MDDTFLFFGVRKKLWTVISSHCIDFKFVFWSLKSFVM